MIASCTFQKMYYNKFKFQRTLCEYLFFTMCKRMFCSSERRVHQNQQQVAVTDLHRNKVNSARRCTAPLLICLCDGLFQTQTFSLDALGTHRPDRDRMQSNCFRQRRVISIKTEHRSKSFLTSASLMNGDPTPVSYSNKTWERFKCTKIAIVGYIPPLLIA